MKYVKYTWYRRFDGAMSLALRILRSSRCFSMNVKGFSKCNGAASRNYKDDVKYNKSTSVNFVGTAWMPLRT